MLAKSLYERASPCMMVSTRLLLGVKAMWRPRRLERMDNGDSRFRRGRAR